MSRQPVQRDLFEQLRRQSEVMRTDEIAASDRINDRNNEAMVAAAQARQAAQAALTAANAAAAAAGVAAAAVATANFSVAEATNAIAAANGATAAANAATATADARLTQLARTTVQSVTTQGDKQPPSSGAWINDLGLILSGSWEGLLSIVRIAIPCSGYGGASTPYSRRLNFQLRLNGAPVCERQMSVVRPPNTNASYFQEMTMTYTHRQPHGPGITTYELWWSGGTDGFIDAGDLEPTRAMTATLIAG